MGDTIQTLLLLSGYMAVWTVVLFVAVWFGFRMGRQSIDRPLPPIIKPKVKPGSLVDADPFYEPMHGKVQNRPTVEG